MSMSNRKYYVHYTASFANTYRLWYVEPEMPFAIPAEWERITRQEAIALARAEVDRQRYDRAFAFGASASVAPAMVNRPRQDGSARWVAWDDVAQWEYDVPVRNHIVEMR